MVQWVKPLASVSSISQNPQKRGRELPSESYYLDSTVGCKHSDSNNNDGDNNIDHTTIKVIYKVTI